MNRIGIFFFMLLIFTCCSNEVNEKKENNILERQVISKSSILGKWQITDSNPLLEGTLISEYLKDNTFKQNGVITSFQPSYTCQAASHGTFSITNDILSYAYLAEKMFDCKPEEYQLMVNSFMGSKALEASQNRIILLNKKTMIQENLATKKRFTFTRLAD